MTLRARLLGLCGIAAGFNRRDPTLFLLAFAAWMLLNAVSLLAPGSAFAASPLFALARELRLPELLVGGLMLLNAFALLWRLGAPQPRVPAWLALVSGGLWCFWALLMFLSGLRVGLFSATASWNVAAALAMLQTSYGPAALAADRADQAGDGPPMSTAGWADRASLDEDGRDPRARFN